VGSVEELSALGICDPSVVLQYHNNYLRYIFSLFLGVYGIPWFSAITIRIGIKVVVKCCENVMLLYDSELM
jgi:hypothetical protein